MGDVARWKIDSGMTVVLACDYDSLAAELAEARAECLEQARLLGMSGSREAKLIAERDAVRAALELLVKDVAGYPAYERPCHALDVARAALSQPTQGDGT